MRTYANAEYYANEYLAGKKPGIKAGFDYYAREASRIIDQNTFNRLKDTEDVMEEVKMCCCELAEQCFNQQTIKTKTGGKVSEKVGTYSVSFASASECSQSDWAEERGIIMKWLGNTGLCYCGVRHVHKC